MHGTPRPRAQTLTPITAPAAYVNGYGNGYVNGQENGVRCIQPPGRSARPLSGAPCGMVRAMNYRRHDAFARICQLAGQAIGQYRMIQAGDRLVVGVSGGKDSLVLMHVLTRLQARAPVTFSVQGVTIDMGFNGFRGEALTAYAASRGWRFERVAFPGRELIAEKLRGTRPCSLCARLRRGQLYRAADRLGCNVLVLGQHLDDLCVSLLMSLLRGNGLKTMGPHVRADHGRKRLIRPLCQVPERLLIEAAREFAFPDFGVCDYLPAITAHGDRAALERLLADLDHSFPGVRHHMLQSMRNLQPGHLLDTRFLQLPPATDDEGGVAAEDDEPEA